MAFEIKEELRNSNDVGVSENNAPGMSNAPSIQSIQITQDEALQQVLVDVVLDDLDSAKRHQDEKDYGVSSKGDKLNFENWYKSLKDLYNAHRIPKTIPWKFCSNRSLRIATSILEMLHARIFPSVWNEDLIRWRPGGIEDVPKTDRITKFMKWWVVVRSKLRVFFDNWTKSCVAFGDVLCESLWDVNEKVTTTQEPVLDEMGQPLTNLDGTQAFSKVPKIDRMEKTVSRIIEKDSFFFLEGTRDIQKDPVLIKEKIKYKDLEDLERRGKAVNVISKLKPLIKVQGMAQGLEAEEAERIRQIKLRNEPIEIVREYLHYDIEGTGYPESVLVLVSEEHRLYLGGVRMRDITKSGDRPLNFTKYQSRIDHMEELWGEGVLEQLRELAEEVDAIFNQLTDSNTLSVLRPLFYDPSGDIDAPAMQLAPNKMIPVSDPARNVMVPQIDINTDRLLNAIRLVLEFIERLTAASSYVMGKESEIVGGSGTATRTQAIVQSAEIRFSRPVERLKEGAAQILKTHLDLLQLNIPPGLETRVLGEKGEMIFAQGELTDIGISGEYDAYIANDPTLGSKSQERELASMLYSMLLQNIIVGTDPAKIYKVTADVLKAWDKDPVVYLGPAPQTDDIDEPEDENTLIIQGDFSRVRAMVYENHILHIQKHSDLLKSPSLQLIVQQAPNLYQQIVEYTQIHIQEHMQQMQAMMGLVQKLGGGGGQKQQGGMNGNNSDSGAKEGPQGMAPQFGMENMPGPLGEALTKQREGKVGSPSKG